MSISIRFKRGKTAAISGVTELVGTLVIDTEKKNLRLHDGSTVGGVTILNETEVQNLITTADTVLESRLDALEAKKFALQDTANTFTAANTFTDTVDLGSAATVTVAENATDTSVVNKGYVDTAIQTVESAYVPLTQKGVAEGVATLDANGKLVTSQLPALSITSVHTVATIEERDNLTDVQEGDLVIVVTGDDGFPHTYINNGSTSEVKADHWTEIVTASNVVSVAGKTGVVTLEKADVGLNNVDNYATATAEQAQDLTSTTSNEAFMTALRVKEMLTAAGLSIDNAGDVVIDCGTITEPEEAV